MRSVWPDVAAAVLTVASALPAAALDLEATAAHGRNLIRATRLLESGELESGALEVWGSLALTDEIEATLSVQVPRADLPETGSRWTLTLLAPAVDADALSFALTVEWPSGVDAAGWSYVTTVSVPDDFQDAALAVEDLTTGNWGAVLVELTDEPPAAAAGLVALAEGGRGARPPSPPTSRSTSGPSRPEASTSSPPRGPTPPSAPGAISPATPAERGQVIRLIPPSDRPAVGRVRLRTVVALDGVRSAVFFLDGEPVETDDRPPFGATIDLGPEPRARLIRVEARGSQDLLLGSDQITVNLEQQPFAVRIQSLDRGDAGETAVTAAVSVPPGEALDRVEIYKNELLVATLNEVGDGGLIQTVLRGDLEPSDFARVVAFLDSGASIEDARLLSEQVASERIDVNLVEVYAVVTDSDGRTVPALTETSFRLRRGRRDVPIERFALADEVPLVLGLIIDSSESMDFLMEDTKRAAATFISQTVFHEDSAFLVDFDTRPRLAQSLTDDIGALLSGLRRMQVGGNTAIYDAIIYSLSQFEREPGRRALVLLTDGRDYGSKFSTKRCLEEARRLGVPVYVIAISDAYNRLPGGWMSKKPKKAPPADAFLESFSKATGGRLFSIADMNELGGVYAVINAELRNQYLLAFSTSAPLGEKELAEVEVDVEGRGLSVRTVVLDR